MSTFDGLIREFPTVAIDNFKIRPGVNVYLLSHVHSDHLTGLASKTWDAPIRCSQITAKWLPMLASRPKQTAYESGQDKAMQRKYAHLTPFLEFAISDLINFINRRPRLAHYYIDAWTFGYEEIWIGLSNAYHSKIHVSPYLYELYEAIDDLISPRILPHLTLDGTSARFHSCRLGPTCGYGGAGGENSAYINYACHASLSELRKLVELVSPRALFPCVLHRDTTFGTLFQSNREVVALLTQSMCSSSATGLVQDVVGYRDQRPCLEDGISTDFQSFHRAKGFNVLDMNDYVALGISAAGSSQRQQPREKKAKIVVDLDEESPISRAESTVTTTKAPAVLMGTLAILSPRSNHLRKKMERLKRQLRNTASLEDDIAGGKHVMEGDESTIEDGPLSLDLMVIERKRKWWLEDERGKSTTPEEVGYTTDEESSLQSTTPLNHGGPPQILSNSRNSATSASTADNWNVIDGDGVDREPAVRTWYDQSTLELELSVGDRHEEEKEGREDKNWTMAYGSAEYLSSSPDPVSDFMSEDIELPTSCGATIDTSVPASRAIAAGLSISSPAAVSLPITFQVVSPVDVGQIGVAASGPISIASSSDNGSLTSSYGSLPLRPRNSVPPSIPKSSSPQPHHHHYQPGPEVVLGDSPTKSQHDLAASVPAALPSSPGSPLRSRGTISPPKHNIFAQLAWSPPLRATRPARLCPAPTPTLVPVFAKLLRAQTDPRQGPLSERKPHFSMVQGPKRAGTTIVDDQKEVVLIESSEEESGDEWGSNSDEKPTDLKGSPLKTGAQAVLHPPKLKKRNLQKAAFMAAATAAVVTVATETQRRKSLETEAVGVMFESQDTAWLEYPEFDLEDV
ncbi:hypothetical protein BGZ98_001562 [Dissophora globulifera]|nr:hypothetical protein BGZ98_001562 [Dissophora globulifera]